MKPEPETRVSIISGLLIYRRLYITDDKVQETRLDDPVHFIYQPISE